MQPVVYNSCLRFHENAIVNHLLDYATARGCGMNELACLDFSTEDREQFAQLIGYSLSGFSELGYVREETLRTAERISETGESEGAARIATLESMLAEIREHLRNAACAAFQIHPDDLHS